MKINFAYKYRIYPNKQQKELLSKHFGCTRFVFNYFLNERKEYYLNNKEEIEAKRIKGGLNYYDNAKELTQIKKEKEWLREVNSQSLQASLKNLESAYRMFFRKTHNFPRFKSKFAKQSFTVPQNLELQNNKILFPKFKEGVKVKEHRQYKGKFRVATLSKTKSNKYYISIIVEKEVKTLKKLQTSVGIDVGIKDLAICSNGKVYENKKYLSKKEKKLKFFQKQLAKKKKSSKNRQIRKVKIAKLHEKIRNSRIDYIHKVSKEIANENQVVVLEDLNVAGMLGNHKLAKSISDVAWNEFRRQLDYKCSWAGRNLILIDRFFPSSKTCYHCNYINQNLKLKHRSWQCPQCKKELNRDLNASRNILRQGLKKAVGTTV